MLGLVVCIFSVVVQSLSRVRLCDPMHCSTPGFPVPILFRGSYRQELEKDMTTHSSILAWRIPWTEEPGRLQSMMSQSVTQTSKVT